MQPVVALSCNYCHYNATAGYMGKMWSIQEGLSEKNSNFYYIPADDIIKKCVYWRKKRTKFFSFIIQTVKQVRKL